MTGESMTEAALPIGAIVALGRGRVVEAIRIVRDVKRKSGES
jgi:hypothetical protein